MSAPQIPEFIAEAKEHLAEVCDQLLRLESCSGNAARARIEQMLRAVHSVKGGAGFFGLRSIEQVAHRMETVLEAVLTETAPHDSRTVDVLLLATDRMAALLDNIEGSETVDVRNVISQLDDFLIAASSPKSALKLEDSPATARVEAHYDTATAASKQPARTPAHQFSIAIDLSACDASGMSPLVVVERVHQLGEIVEGSIDTPELDLEQSPPTEPVIWRATIASELNADEFRRQLDVPSTDAQRGTSSPSAAPSNAATMSPPTASAGAVAPAVGMVDRSTTIRIPVSVADRLMNLAGELVLVRNQARRFADAGQPLPVSVVQKFNAVTTEVQETVLQTRMQPIGNLFGKFPRLVRDLARQLEKQIDLQVSGAEVEIDKTILDAIGDPLTHLVRNACDHGVELPEMRESLGKSPTARIELTARHSGDQICITVADDGRGIDREAVLLRALKQEIRTPEALSQLSDRELLALILMPGFSTAVHVTDVSGRGVGMDVVRTNLARLGGSLEIDSVAGLGTTFTLRLPLTLAIIPGLLVTASGQRYVIPQKNLEELVCVDAEQTRVRIEWTRDQEMVRLRGKLLPLIRSSRILRADAIGPMDEGPPSDTQRLPLIVAVLKTGSRRFGLVIDNVLSNEEVVVKPMHTRLRALSIYSGATILGDGSVALILNAEGIAGISRARFGTDAETTPQFAAQHTVESRMVLLLRQGNGEPAAVPAAMVRRVVLVYRGQFERVGNGRYVAIDGVPTRVVPLSEHDDNDAMEDGVVFVLLPRNSAQAIGCVINEVLGIEQIDPGDIHPHPADPTALGAAVVRGRITPLVDLKRRLSDALIDESAVAKHHSSTALARVLLVDDTQFFRDLVGRYLMEAGYVVTFAEHGAAALEWVQRAPFDIIVSDLEMPVMDGFALAVAVRQINTPQQLPMLALSTLVGDEVRAKALAQGFDAYEVKLDQASLLGAVQRLLERRQAGTLTGEACHA